VANKYGELKNHNY